MDAVDLQGKTVLVTGANSGIGRETARGLAAKGARVVLGCRSSGRGEEARQDIIKTTGNTDVVVYPLNLASLQSVRSFAETFNQNENRLDILVNNAGVLTQHRCTTEDGFEMMFGVNHLGHFLLTYLLMDKLKFSAPSRVVTVSSVGHKWAPIDFSDLQSERNFGSIKTYGKAKTANVLFTVHLAEVLKGTGVSTYCLHPGLVDTGLGRDMNGCCMKCLFTVLFKCCWRHRMLTSAQGAMTSLYCALEPSIQQHSGRYYDNCKESRAKSHAVNPETVQKLWDTSMRLCGLDSDVKTLPK